MIRKIIGLVLSVLLLVAGVVWFHYTHRQAVNIIIGLSITFVINKTFSETKKEV